LKRDPNFQNGVPEMLLLRLLTGREMYGYELVKEIRRTSGGILGFGEGSVYPILHHLQAKGFVSSRIQAASGRSRTYYRLTPAGQKRLKELKCQWEQVVEGVTLALENEYA
jgi:PadR family transcriptional regulator PadR